MAQQCVDVPKLPGLSTQTDGLASDADSSDNFKSLLIAHLLFNPESQVRQHQEIK